MKQFRIKNFLLKPLPVATSLHERWPDKAIIIVGDDNHPLKNNPWCSTAAGAAKGMLNTEEKEHGLTDFNDLGWTIPTGTSVQRNMS